MKTKLFRILSDGERKLAAVFEGPSSWQDARLCAMMFAERELTDLIITAGKADEMFPSRKTILCPCCRTPFRLVHLEERRPYDTKRCECGTLFTIDWEFSNRELEILDIGMDEWIRYRRFLGRQIDQGKTLGEAEARGLETAERWIANHHF